MMSPTNKIISEYQLLEQVGHGIAEIHRGRHFKTERDYFISVISKANDSISINPICFKQHAERLTQLRHPNILGVLDYGETEEVVYLVTNYV